VKLTIEKLVYGGDGLARTPEGKAAFVPFVLPGEEVSASIIENKPGFVRATADEILKPSALRIGSGCPYYAACGGCHYQHAGYEAQLGFKRDILRETLRRTAKFEWPGEIATHAAEPWHYRNRTRLRLRTQPEFALGYHRFHSNDLLPVRECPISSPLINRGIGALWALAQAHGVPEGAEEIEFFANHDDSRLLLEIYGRVDTGVREGFASALQTAIPEIAGVAFFTGASGQPAKRDAVIGDEFLFYRAGDEQFRVSAGSFFQTNRLLADELVKTVVSGAAGGTALDLYAGVGLFAVHLARSFRKVLAVESGPSSAADLEHNAPKNVTATRSTVEAFLPRAANLNPDLVVVDPPRAGLGERITGLPAGLHAARIVYVSCDPATLARDLRQLLASGYRVEEVHLMDLFPQTFHIETVIKLAR